MKTVPMTLYVTPKDLREGDPYNPQTCAVARALKRAFRRHYPQFSGEAIASIVLANLVVDVYHEDPTDVRMFWWMSSSALQEYIHDWDAGLTVKPAKFVITPPKNQ